MINFDIVLPSINFYFSPNIIRMMSGRMRWARHGARMGEKRKHLGYWWESQKETYH
jgi:hypothetical protein